MKTDNLSSESVTDNGVNTVLCAVDYWKNTDNVDLPGETWKDVLGYEGIYSVSIFGRIRSFHTNRILKQWYGGDSNLMVTLCADGNENKIFVSNIVGMTYIGIPNRKNKECFCHLDKNPYNNCVSNISIETRKHSTLLSYHAGCLKDWGIKNVGKETQFVSKYRYIGINKKTQKENTYYFDDLLTKYGTGIRSIQRCLAGEKNFKSAYGQFWRKELI
jgi:hypothetical protein